MYSVIYKVPGYAPVIRSFDNYTQAKSVYDMKAGCKTNKGEITKLISIRRDGYEVEILTSEDKPQ